MKIKVKTIGKLLKTSFAEWKKKDPFRQSAVIAYYSVFSMPGLIFLIITLAGYFFNQDMVSKNISKQIAATMGAETAAQINGMLTNIHHSQSTILATIIGIIVLLIGATGVFVELQKSMNIIWEVKALPQKGIWSLLKSRLFSFGIILAIAFLLLISLVISTALVAFSNRITGDSTGLLGTIFNILNFIFSLSIISVLFAFMFKFFPDVKIKWKNVWLGSLLTGILFELGKTALAFYFGKVQPSSVYGAAGSIVLILLWVSYSSMIVFFGAEFTASFSALYDGKVRPSEIAKKPMEKQIL